MRFSLLLSLALTFLSAGSAYAWEPGDDCDLMPCTDDGFGTDAAGGGHGFGGTVGTGGIGGGDGGGSSGMEFSPLVKTGCQECQSSDALYTCEVNVAITIQEDPFKTLTKLKNQNCCKNKSGAVLDTKAGHCE